MISGVLWANGPIRTLPQEALAPIKNSEQARVANITAHVESLKANYGFGARDGLQEIRHSTDEFGKTHVHFKQLYQGTPVWGSSLLGHMDAQGSLEATKATVYSGIALEATTLLPAEAVRNLSLKRLAVSATSMPVKVEKIVFPTQLNEAAHAAGDERLGSVKGLGGSGPG
jgi:Zn-dependent metalloprotease